MLFQMLSRLERAIGEDEWASLGTYGRSSEDLVPPVSLPEILPTKCRWCSQQMKEMTARCWPNGKDLLMHRGSTTNQVSTLGHERSSKVLHVKLLKEFDMEVPRLEKKVLLIRGIDWFCHVIGFFLSISALLNSNIRETEKGEREDRRDAMQQRASCGIKPLQWDLFLTHGSDCVKAIQRTHNNGFFHLFSNKYELMPDLSPAGKRDLTD